MYPAPGRLPMTPLFIDLIDFAPVPLTFRVILPTAPLLVAENLTFTIVPTVSSKAVVSGVIVATLATVPAGVVDSAYQIRTAFKLPCTTSAAFKAV